MLKKTFIFFLSILLIMALPVISMELPKKSIEKTKELPSQVKIFISNEDNIAKHMNTAINSLPAGSDLSAASPFGNNLFKSVCKAGKKNKLNTKILKGKGGVIPENSAGTIIKEQSTLHAKYLLGKKKIDENSAKEPQGEEQNQSNTFSFIGSDNGSGVSARQIEIMFNFNDTKSYKKLAGIHKQFTNDKTPEKKSKKILAHTPSKIKFTSSFDYNLNQSKIQRISSLKKQYDSAGDTLYISSMTFDIEALVKELEEVISERKNKLNCALFFNKDILNHHEIVKRLVKLKDLNEDTEHDVNLYIYNPRGDIKIVGNTMIPRILHAKLFYRKTDDQKLIIGSTGNLTEQSNTERNIDFLLPEKEIDEEVIVKIENFFELLKNDCVKITHENMQDFIDSHTDKKKEQAQKKKLKNEAQRKSEKTEEETESESEKTKSKQKKIAKKVVKKLFLK